MADPNHTQPSLDGEPSQSQLPVNGSKFDALKKAMGAQSDLLNELPFHRVKILHHADDELIGRKTLSPWKIRVGTTKLFGEPIHAYLLSQGIGNLAVSFFSISQDEQDVTIHDISTLVNEDLREEYAGAPTQESLKALVKLYFIQSGVCDNISVTFSKSLVNEIDRVCKSWAKPRSRIVGREPRRASVFVDPVRAQSSSPEFFSFQLPSRPATPSVSVAPMMYASQPVTSVDRLTQQPQAHSTISQSLYLPTLQAAQNTFNEILEQSSRNSSDSTISGSEILNFPIIAPSTQRPLHREPHRQATIPFQPQSQPQVQIPATRRVPTEVPAEPELETITFANYSTLFQAPYSALRTTLSTTNNTLTTSRASLSAQDARISQAKAQIAKAHIDLASAKKDKESTVAKIKDLEHIKERVRKEQKALVGRLDGEVRSVWEFASGIKDEDESSEEEGPERKRMRKE